MPEPGQAKPRRTDAPSADAPGRASAIAIADQSLIVFQVADQSFAMRLDSIAEIVRVPGLTRMPLTPPALLGLANLHGVVLPVVSLRQLLRLPDAPSGHAGRVIVAQGDAPVGFAVDRVQHLLSVPARRIGTGVAGAGGIDPDLLDGTIPGEEGETTIQILNPLRLLRDEFSELGAARGRASSRVAIGAAMRRQTTAPPRHQLALVSFALDQQEYAVPLEHVRAVIPLSEQINQIAGSEPVVLGVVTLRGRVLPLVSLRTLLGMASDVRPGQRRKVVVIAIGGGAVGIVTDGTREILRIDADAIDPAPALLTRGMGEAEITSICRLEGGRRLVGLLSPDRLFRSDLVRRILADQAQPTVAADSQTDVSIMADEQFIVFWLGGQEFGLPIAAVSEIARPPDHMTRLPKAPAFIDGIINLRGSVVPIIDLGRRFELPIAGQGRSRRVLVMSIGDGKAGLLVDSVSGVVTAPAGAICPAPQLSPEQIRLNARILNLEAEDRLILLLDPAKLLDRVEADILAGLDASGLDQAPAAP